MIIYNISMTLCIVKRGHGKVEYGGFSTRLIENSAFTLFMRYENFCPHKLIPQGNSSDLNSPCYTTAD